tara:strand:+ start:4002 stop:4256 length:255 start_codon:yes stop_codon:yes gene_type:complete
MKRIFNFFGELISSKSDTSSKRFIALWCTFLVTAIVSYALYKAEVKDSIIVIFNSLLWFIGILLGVAGAQAILKGFSDKDKTEK